MAGASGMKQSLPKELSTQLDEIQGKIAKTSGDLFELEDKKKRWLLVGVGLHTILSPALRKYVKPKLDNLWQTLKASDYIDTEQNSLVYYNGYELNYEAINNNRRHQMSYYYSVKNSIDLSKLFLQTDMAKYSAFDEGCDASALLGIIINTGICPAGEKCAEQVRSDIRNAWAHCDYRDWTAVKYKKCSKLMNDLVKYLGFPHSEKKEILDRFDRWNQNGDTFIAGTTLELAGLTEIKDHVQDLVKCVKSLADTPEQIEKIQKELSNIDQVLKEHGELLSEHTQRIGQLETANQEQSDKIGQLETAKQEQSDKIGQLETAKQEQSDKIGQLETAQQEQSDKIGQLETAKQEQSEKLGQLETAKQEHTDKLGQLETAKQEHTEKLGQIETAKQEQSDKIGQLETAKQEQSEKIGQVETAKQEHTEKIEQLETAQQEQSEKIGQVETAQQEHTEKIEQLETAKQEHTEKIEQLETAKQEHTEKIEQLETAQQEHSEKIGQVETAQQEHSEKLGQIETAQQEHSEKLGQVETAQQEHSEKIGQVETAQQEHSEKIGQVETAQQEHTEKIEQLETTKQEQSEKIEQLETAKQEHTEKIEQLETAQQEQSEKIGQIEKETKDNTGSIAKLEKKIEEKEDSIPKHLKETHKIYVDGWEKDEEKFTVTRATKQVASLIKVNNVVVVVGSSGSGKSSIIHHVALNLKTEHGFDIIPIVTSPVDIIQFRDVSKNQLFVIDDLCGKNYLDETDLEAWKNKSKIIEKLFPESSNEQGKLKILVSCRLQIFNTDKFKNLHLFTKEAVDLQSQKYCLLADEKLKMIQKYLKVTEEDWQEINEDLAGCQYFPLLCKLGQDKNMEEFKQLIASPIDCIRNDLKDTIQNKPMENCALVLCVLFPDGFHKDFINPRTRPQNVQQKITDISNTYEINLANERNRAQLNEAFERLDGTYVKRIGPMYSIAHDMLYDIVAIEGSYRATELYLQHSPSNLIAEKFRINSIFYVNSNEFVIYLHENDENLYFDRIVQDLKQAKSYKPFFHNQQLKEEKYRRKVMEYIEQNRKSCNELFRRLDREGMTEERWFRDDDDDTYTYHTTPVIEAAKTGFYDLVQYFIQINCDCNKKDSYDDDDGYSPLYYSCENGFVKVVDLLIRHGVEYRVELVLACLFGKIDVVRVIADSGVDLSVCDSKYGWTPLIAACFGGQSDVVELLLDKGADPLQTDGWDETALYWARWREEREEERDDTIINLLKSHMKQ